MRNHLGLALMNQQNNLRDLASSDARLDLQKANLGLQGAQFSNQLDRQRRFEDPVLQLNADQATAMNDDLTIDQFASRLEHRNKMLESDGGYDAIASVFGAKYDPQTRKLVRNGQPVKRWEYEQDPNKQANVKRIKWGFISPAQDIPFNRALIEDKQAKGDPLTPDEEQFYQKTSNMGPEQIANVLKADLRNMQASYAQMMQDPEVPDEAKQAFLFRLQAQTQELQGVQSQLEETSRRQFELQKIDRQKTAAVPQGPGFYDKEDYKYYMEQLDDINTARRKGGTEDEFGTFTPYTPEQFGELDRQEQTIRDAMSVVRGGKSQEDNASVRKPTAQGGLQVQPDGSIYTDTLPSEPDEKGQVTINGKKYRVESTEPQKAQPKPGEAQAAEAPVAPVAPVKKAPAPQAPPEQRATPGNGDNKTVEQWMAENPDLARQPGIMSLLDANMSEEEKLRRIKRKADQMRKSFVRKPPMVN